MGHKPGHILGKNEDSWNYIELPSFPTIRGKVPYTQPVRLEDSTGFEDLQQQFNSPSNQTWFGPKSVEQRTEDYNGLGPGRIIIKGKTNTPEGIFFYPDNKEYAKAAIKDIQDVDNIQQMFQSLSILGGATAGAKTIIKNRNRLPHGFIDPKSAFNVKPVKQTQAQKNASAIEEVFNPIRAARDLPGLVNLGTGMGPHSGDVKRWDWDRFGYKGKEPTQI